MIELKVTTFNENFPEPEGLVLRLPPSGQTMVIYDLLRNGVNLKVTLDKASGSRVVYELEES